MTQTRAYTNGQFVFAVCLAALLGWAAVALPATFSYAARSTSITGNLSYLLWAGIIGLPMAFISSLVVAAPILWRLMAHRIGW